GDTVDGLDTLFSYWNTLHDDDGSKSVQISNSNEWVRKEKLNLLRQISEKSVVLNETVDLIAAYKLRREKLVQFVMLDAAENASLQSVTNLLLTLESKAEILRSEIYFLRRHYSRLNDEEATLVDLSSGGYSSALTKRQYVSPFRGIIGEIQIQPNEVCYEGEYIFTVHSPDDIEIHAYFSQKYIDRIFLNQVVKVSFPDGSVGKGYIKKYHISTKELPPEFQKKYEPTERTILTEIDPIDKTTAALWKKFYKMDVRVSLPRFGSEVYFPVQEEESKKLLSDKRK
ncbi:MAG: HlyD family efflux transporter periplasmic adaptor subunit, partial [Ekhidna sp.]|nr:HlyD family efflux transporter periplasmic adaptor subunit [Ekhidna sp.]